jgi:hypothetical protein
MPSPAHTRKNGKSRNRQNALSFEEMLANLKKDPNWRQLPDIRSAMAPHQVSFADDLSDAALFNERYVESRAFDGKSAFALRLTCAAGLASSIVLALTITSSARAGRSWEEIVSLNWMLTLLSVLLFVVAYRFSKIEPVYVRFNRQAQLVHIYRGPNQAVTAPWREVQAFTRFSASGRARFSLRLVFRTGPSDLEVVSGAFDIRDESAMAGNLLRLEFLRRYMAEGLSAVQPDPAGTVRNPGGFSRPAKGDGGLLEKLVMRPGYYLTGGFWIDRYLLRRAANIQWPEAVRRLCAPGADLSAYDTTPVHARKDAHHRLDGNGFEVVDIAGNVIG